MRVDGPAAAATGPVPEAAIRVFGAHLDLAIHYVTMLAGTGITHGLIGPREAPRLWERHVLNCAVIESAFTAGAEVVDIGSGAGLPGLVLAIVRPDLHLHLVEPLARRTAWLDVAVRDLALDNVTVHTCRAEALHHRLVVPYVTARAVSGLAALAQWGFPLLPEGGQLVALKGSTAASELDADWPRLRQLGAAEAAIRSYGEGVLASPTTAVVVSVGAREPDQQPQGLGQPSLSGRGRRRPAERKRTRHKRRG
jgi:16S rRNA (guanine527-N7)-methyltransferase